MLCKLCSWLTLPSSPSRQCQYFQSLWTQKALVHLLACSHITHTHFQGITRWYRAVFNFLLHLIKTFIYSLIYHRSLCCPFFVPHNPCRYSLSTLHLFPGSLCLLGHSLTMRVSQSAKIFLIRGVAPNRCCKALTSCLRNTPSRDTDS